AVREVRVADVEIELVAVGVLAIGAAFGIAAAGEVPLLVGAEALALQLADLLGARWRRPHPRQLARLVGELEDVDAEGGVLPALPDGDHVLLAAAGAPLLVRLEDHALQPLEAGFATRRVSSDPLVALAHLVR